MSVQLKKILITDEVDSVCVDILKENGLEVVKDTTLARDKEKLLAEIKGYDGLIVRSATKVTSDVIKAGVNLKIIGRAGTGVDNIDCKAATEQGVIVMNTPGGNTLSAAELTCAMILAISRHICQGTMSLCDGRWERKKLIGSEVSGKTLAIIGLGRIGEKVAERMQSFEMTTIGYDPIIPAEVSAKFGVKWMPLEEIWPLADYITLHTPLIPETKDLINDEVLAKCKKGVCIINCARGGIVNEAALLRALNSGQCGGAGLDVFEQEPPTNMELLKHARVTSTPHLGANTEEAQIRVAKQIAIQIVDLMKKKNVQGAINANMMANAFSSTAVAWQGLVTCLGTLASQMVKTLSPISITIQGNNLKKYKDCLVAAMFVGLLHSESNNNKLNLISATALANKLQMKVDTTEQDGTEEQVTLSVCGRSVCGTLGASGLPLLTGVNGCQLEQGFQLTDNILLLFKAQPEPQIMPDVMRIVTSSGSQLTSFVSGTNGNTKCYMCHVTEISDWNEAFKSLVDEFYSVKL